MKLLILGILFVFVGAQTFAQTSAADQEIITLSKDKWQWMSDKNMDALTKLFHEKAVFVHMGGAWGTERELDIIKGGGIWYKKADIHEASVKFIDNTAIVLNRIAGCGGWQRSDESVYGYGSLCERKRCLEIGLAIIYQTHDSRQLIFSDDIRVIDICSFVLYLLYC
jgi:Domain of unknown function (DUF4440)